MNIYEEVILESKQMDFGGHSCTIDFDEILPVMDAYQEHLNQERWFEAILEEINPEDEETMDE